MISNLTQPEKDVWERRLHAILQMIEIIQKRHHDQAALAGLLSNNNMATVTRNGTITGLLGCLKAFSERHFDFFLQGFAEKQTGRPQIILETPKPLSAHYIFGSILDRVANDLAVIQRASEQRMIGSLNAQQITTNTFHIADQLAMLALKRIERLLESGSTVLTYLIKSADARIVPYAPVALIGIPLTSYGLLIAPDADGLPMNIGLGRDLLAIPHELGHHLYWNGREKADNTLEENFLRNQIRLRYGDSLPKWLENWLEEIFADVVSCWIGGPVTALSFQDLQLQTRDDWLLMDNGVHPIAALRPYIYSETFRQLGMTAVADQLEQRWGNKLQALDPEGLGLEDLDIDPKQALSFTPFHLPNQAKPARVLQPLAKIIESGIIEQCIAILKAGEEDLNLASLPVRMWVGTEAMQLNLATEEGVQELYRQFEEWVKSDVAQMDNPMNLNLVPKKWAATVRERGVAFDIAGLPLDKKLLPAELYVLLSEWENDSLTADESLSPADWRPIFEFAGWSTEGPTDGNLTG